MIGCNQPVEVYRAQFDLISHRFTQPGTAWVKSRSASCSGRSLKQFIIGIAATPNRCYK